MKKIVGALVAALVAGAGLLYFGVATLSPAPARAATAQGTVREVSNVQVRAALSGRVSEIAADFKTPVKRGQALARIDASAYVERVNQARIDLDAARAAKAGAVLKQRQAQLKQAELDLERTVIRAPVNGTVILRNVHVGQTLEAGTQAFTIAPDLHTVQVETAVDEAQAQRLRTGMSATFSVDALPRRTFSGEIVDIRKGRPYSVVIGASNVDLALMPGMTANVRFLPAR